jgi:hypothetical protein
MRSLRIRSRRECRELFDQMIVRYDRCYHARLPRDLSPLRRSARSRQLPPDGAAWSVHLEQHGLMASAIGHRDG